MQRKQIKKTRVNNEVKKALSSILDKDIHDSRIHHLTSIVSVQVTQDLKFCKVEVSVLGSKEEIENTKKGLDSAKGFIRSRLAKTLNMRNTPELTFIMNDSIDYAIKMSSLIDEVVKDDESKKRN